MIRRLALVVLASALMVSACGRQVTPNKPGLSGPPAGFMQIKFRVNSAFNFSAYSYVVILNTNGNPSNASGSTPLPSGSNTNYQNWNIALVVTQSGGGPTATLWYFQRPNGNPNGVPILLQIPQVAGQVTLNVNSNGLGTEFTVQFLRALVGYYASPSPSPTGTPSSSPSASPSGSPSASPTASSLPAGIGSTWFFNYLVVQGNVGTLNNTISTILDSLGTGGATDSSWVSPALPITTSFDSGSFFALTPINPPSDPATQITGGDISNAP